MATFKIVAKADFQNGGWGILHEMEFGELTAEKFVPVGDKDMAQARSDLLNRSRQHGKSALKTIGTKNVANEYVRFA